MNCEDVQTLLPDYYDDMLSPVTRYAVQNHLKTCEACNKELHEISILFESIAVTHQEQPPASLREHFNQMLQSEISKQQFGKIPYLSRIVPMKHLRLLGRVAAAVLIFLGGAYLGTRLKTGGGLGSDPQIKELQSQVRDVRELMMFKLLREESASDRLEAVNYVNEMSNPDAKVIGALISTLNNDKNVNVRLASLYSLGKFADVPLVIDSLISSLGRQTEPVIQIVLINILTAKKEPRAVKPIQDILSSSKTLKEVKEIAAKGLKSM